MADKIIIIPTYNEKENIEAIIRVILYDNESFEILIVDDNSPDGTAEIVEKLQKEFENRLHLQVRQEKNGLGQAYIDGFRWVLKKDYAYILEMDADFSHNPSDLIRLYKGCQSHDVAVGSRYSNGVNIVNWPMYRVLLSYFASKYVRWITGLPIHDTTAGFICYKRSVIESIPLKEINCSGYLFQIKMKYIAWKKGFKIKEIPIIFTDRVAGTSKMSGKIINEALWGVLCIKIQSLFKKNKKQMKKIFLIILALLCSCKNNIEKPNDLISPNQMKNILIDLLLTEEIVLVSNTKDISKINFQAKNRVLKKYGITEGQFQNSNNYYTLEKKIYLKILKEAEDSLNHIR